MIKKSNKLGVGEIESLSIQPKKRIQTAEGWKRNQLKGKKKEMRQRRKSEAA